MESQERREKCASKQKEGPDPRGRRWSVDGGQVERRGKIFSYPFNLYCRRWPDEGGNRDFAKGGGENERIVGAYGTRQRKGGEKGKKDFWIR